MRLLTFVDANEAVRTVKNHYYIHISRAGQLPFILSEALRRGADAGGIEAFIYRTACDVFNPNVSGCQN